MSRIVFLTHSAAPAGAEVSLFYTLQARHPSYDVLTIFGEHGAIVDRFAAAGLPHVVLPLGAGLATARRKDGLWSRLGQVAVLARYVRALRRELKVQDPAVVVGRSLKAVVYGRLATWGLGIPFVWCLHDRLTRDYLGRSHVFWSWALVRAVDGLVVNSRSTLSTVHPHKIPVLVLPPVGAHVERTTTQTGGGLRVVCLARLAPWKGQDVAIRAFAASLGGTDARLRVVGGALFDEDDYAGSLQVLTDDLGIGGQVEFTGHVDSPGDHVATCDVLLHASRIPEPFGMVVVEGMKAGCVVIATTPGGPAEVIEHGVTGLLVDVDDVDSMAEALRKVAQMTIQERMTMGSAAQKAAQAYDPALMSQQYLSWLTSVSRGVAMLPLTVTVSA